MDDVIRSIQELDIWTSDIELNSVEGGITNHNYIAIDGGKKYFVRLGNDIPEHGIMRFNELAASKAAHKAGLSPELIYAESGIMVLQYLDAVALTAKDIRNPKHLSEVVKLIYKCHNDIPSYFRGPALVFWVFQVLRDYSQTLTEGRSQWSEQLTGLLSIAQQLEQDIGEVELVFSHNDLLAANFLYDNERLWLIDWEYAGFNSPLFDLGGLASNNELSKDEEEYLLTSYYGKTPDKVLLKKYSAMKCASLLRETLWSMVSEIQSAIDFDYETYTKDNLSRFQQAWELHQRR